jgi:SUN domain-containing protein 1/2
MSSPDHSIASAPKAFSVYGLHSLDEEEPRLLGSFVYSDNNQPVQTFPLEDVGTTYELIELRVLSNHGHQVYTCLYRFRVHGDLPTGQLEANLD